MLVWKHDIIYISNSFEVIFLCITPMRRSHKQSDRDIYQYLYYKFSWIKGISNLWGWVCSWFFICFCIGWCFDKMRQPGLAPRSDTPKLSSMPFLRKDLRIYFGCEEFHKRNHFPMKLVFWTYSKLICKVLHYFPGVWLFMVARENSNNNCFTPL